MQTLVVDRKHARLALDGRRLRVECAGERARFVPLAQIQRLVVFSRIHLESNVLGALAEQGAGVLFLSPRDHRRTALLLPSFGGEHRVRLAQYRQASDSGFAIEVARVILRRKLQQQWRVLRRMKRGVSWRQACTTWPEMLMSLRDAHDLNQMRGIEGGAASLYFAAMREHVPASLGFSGRKRRPPPDPLNALLSLGYTLLHFDAVRAVHQVGLDPAIGFLHEPEYNRESLACDLIEPLRPQVDAFVLSLFRRRDLRREHFSMQQGACRLSKSGRGHFYAAWEQFAVPRRSLLRRGALMLRAAIEAA